ncbi:hypothetical protein [Haloparvum sedimenti]|uniref:hypothetical protein n=1 Tax=Haloparvum sedimenti TaxID=1678448 RepID=UPI00071E9946|nr:hypothetical protein [Haloparvum sedimenti]
MSEDTVRVRVDRGEYRHEREHYTEGDELEVPEKTLRKHPRSLTRVEDSEASVDDGDADTIDDGDDEIVVDPDPSERTVDELRDRVEDVEDVDLLEAIKDAEEDGKDRETAKDAIDARIAELEG